jgi:integrase
VKRPRPKHRTRQSFTAEELHRFLEAARGDRFHALYLLLVDTGLRPGEALALEWEDVDLKAQRLAVRQNLENRRGRLKLKATKTERRKDASTISLWSGSVKASAYDVVCDSRSNPRPARPGVRRKASRS